MYNRKQNVASVETITHATRGLHLKPTEEQPTESKPVFRFSSSESFLCDDNIYRIGEPFDKLEKLMFNIQEDKIKKRVLRSGRGPKISCNSTVTIIYRCYAEFQEQPFNSTRKNEPFSFSLCGPQPMPGLSIAIESMQVGEISQFLINSQFAYGDVGWLNRIKPNDTVLFVVDLKSALNVNDNKKTIRDIFVVTHAICTKGNELFSKGQIKNAIKEYKTATEQLEVLSIHNNIDLAKQRELLLRLYTNLAISYTKTEEPRHACIYCNKIYSMCRGTNLKIPVKVYINHTRSLILLSKFREARRMLEEAKRIEPHNPAITKEFVNLELFEQESTNKIVPVNSICLSKKSIEISKQFKEAMAQYCCDLINDKNAVQYELPVALNQAEQEFALVEIQKHDLYFEQSIVNGATKFFISKSRKFNTSL